MNAVRRLNPSRLLMTGNPFVNSGAFYDSHHSRRELYTTVQIGAFDTPNLRAEGIVVPGMVTAEDIADREEEWGEESALYIGSVLGKFPDNLDDSVVPRWAATEAATREMEPEGPLVVACDVARFGHDKTVVISRQGSVARIGQLSSRRYSHLSDGRIRLESKQKMYRSPDEADALAMTFAVTRGGVKIWV